MTYKPDVTKETWHVANIDGDLCVCIGYQCRLARVYEMETEEAWERARLMAKAPALLRALEAMTEEFASYWGCGEEMPDEIPGVTCAAKQGYAQARAIIKEMQGSAYGQFKATQANEPPLFGVPPELTPDYRFRKSQEKEREK